eukprot:6194233-Pleurochrysis_carterae.AAC.2
MRDTTPVCMVEGICPSNPVHACTPADARICLFAHARVPAHVHARRAWSHCADAHVRTYRMLACACLWSEMMCVHTWHLCNSDRRERVLQRRVHIAKASHSSHTQRVTPLTRNKKAVQANDLIGRIAQASTWR